MDFTAIIRAEYDKNKASELPEQILKIIRNEFKKQLYEFVLNQCKGNSLQAAKCLMLSRTTFAGRCEELKINVAKIRKYHC